MNAKKMTSLFLAWVLLVGACAVPGAGFTGLRAEAEIVQSGYCGENVMWTLDADGLLTISGTGKMEDYHDTFSSSPWGKAVKRIVINQGVKSIGNYGFYDCTDLISVTIPNSVTSIGKGAFYSCIGLLSVTIPNSVTSIGEEAFCMCSSLTAVTIPNSVTSIGYYAFNGCTGLTAVEIPNSVTSIGYYAFNGCTGLTTVTIQNGVKRIGTGAFNGCTGLTVVEIPNSVTSIGYYAFNGCTGLTTVTIPNSITSIGYHAFAGCNKLLHIDYVGLRSEWEAVSKGSGAIPEKTVVSFIDDNIVRYDANGGTGAPSLQTKTEGRALTLSNQIPEKRIIVALNPCGGSVDTAYKSLYARFTVWNTAQNGTGVSYAPGGSYTEDADITLYAQWQNPAVDALPVPVREGYTFTGWYTAETDGEQIARTSVVNVSVTLYAHWIAPLMGDVDADGAVTASDARSVLRAAVGLESFTADQKALADLDGDGNVTASDARLALRTAVGLEPEWRIGDPMPVHTYTVRFSANGGTGAPGSQIKTEGKALTLSAQTPKKAYTLTFDANGGSVSPQNKTVNGEFTGWNTREDGTGTRYSPGDVYRADEDVTLHAQWSGPKAGSLPTPTRSGYIFNGWYTAKSGGTQIDNNSAISENTVLYARWQQNEVEGIFTQIPVEFSFYPGTGGYQSGIEVYEDGTVRGWSTSRAMESGSGYDVTFYETEYTAKLTDVKKIDGYTYSMKLTNLQAKPRGTKISNRIRTVTETPNYVSNGDVFMLYLPGRTSKGLPEYLISLTSWVLSYNSSKPTHFYALYNQTKDQPYWSTDAPAGKTEKALTRIWKEEKDAYWLTRPSASGGETLFIKFDYRSTDNDHKLWYGHGYYASDFAYDWYVNLNTVTGDPNGIVTFTATRPAFAGSSDGFVEPYPERNVTVSFDFTNRKTGLIRYRFDNGEWESYPYTAS